MNIGKRKFIVVLFVCVLSFLFTVQGVLAEGTSFVNITHTDEKNLAAGEKAQISKGNPQVTGDGQNYRYTLVYEKAAPTGAPQATAAPTTTSQSGIPSTGDDQTGGLLYAGMMALSAMALIILLVKGKKWAKGMMVLLLAVCIGGGLQQPAMASGAFPADIQVKVLSGQEYKYTPPAIEGYNYVGYIVEKEEPQPTATPAPIIGRVLVHYVDTLGNTLADSLVLTGEAGDSYQSEAEVIKNYTLTATPENAEGVFAEEDIEVVYIYEENAKSTVTVKYLDVNGKQLADPVVLRDYAGEAYTSEAKAIKGYVLKSVPANANGLFEDRDIEVVYIYEENVKSTVTVYYIDVNGNMLADTAVLRDYIGEPYTSKAAEVENYTLTAIPENAEGVFTEEDIEVIYIYEENPKGRVIINYIDIAGNKLAESALLFGYVGEKYTTSAAKIEHYIIVEMPVNATGEFIDGETTVTYVYQKMAKTTVTIKYLDIDEKHVAEPIVLQGYAGEAYTSGAKAIEGYVLKSVPVNANGQFTDRDIEVTYIYEKILSSTVIVKHVNLSGVDIITPIVLTGAIGDNYTTGVMTDKPEYELVRTEGAPTSGKYTKETQIATYVYQLKEGKVVVTHQFFNGEIIKTVTLRGDHGTAYEVQPLAEYVNDYAYEMSGSYTGTFDANGSKTATVIYTSKGPGVLEPGED